MTAKYELFYRDPRDVIRNMISDTTFKFVFDYIPYQDFDKDRDWQYVLCADYTYLSSTYVDKDQYEGQYLPGMVG